MCMKSTLYFRYRNSRKKKNYEKTVESGYYFLVVTWCLTLYGGCKLGEALVVSNQLIHPRLEETFLNQ